MYEILTDSFWEKVAPEVRPSFLLLLQAALSLNFVESKDLLTINAHLLPNHSHPDLCELATVVAPTMRDHSLHLWCFLEAEGYVRLSRSDAAELLSRCLARAAVESDLDRLVCARKIIDIWRDSGQEGAPFPADKAVPGEIWEIYCSLERFHSLFWSREERYPEDSDFRGDAYLMAEISRLLQTIVPEKQ